MEDPVFGPLAWHDGFLAWKGELVWPGTDRVEVLLDEEDRATGFLAARQSLAWVRDHEREVRQAVAAEFLDWCNDAFAPPVPISREEFLRGVELHQLRLDGDGGLWVLYSDMGLFGGHVFWAEYAADRRLLGFSAD